VSFRFGAATDIALPEKNFSILSDRNAEFVSTRFDIATQPSALTVGSSERLGIHNAHYAPE
jgi:hypothetical protein